jgi:hypothetical protein
MDEMGHVFGAFIPEKWHKNAKNFGNGETFVFSIFPNLKIYPWTRKNSCFVTAKSDYIGFGGGDNFALWVTNGLRQGSSQPCETFNNPCLSSTSQFKVANIELWSLTI